ncbi:hypothetical protein BCR35DRAFT_306425 [Leucosporidium creatinivorum]|uniref:F-box domain-containing protein n=1 Tax=Leucosporidium creatinivorum TaxID=106004 RepID=A0A1Y2EW19_9BASI|nr:hypothetical protein BCR35DRAFT_306425 [Leucosporidium creatinivorum]
MDLTVDNSLSPFESLPPELVLRIIDGLTPQAIVRLSATSRALRSIARSEIVWRTIVQAVLARSKAPEEEEAEAGSSNAAENGEATDDSDVERWWKRATFLLPVSQHLGYFVSSTPYTSRIIRLTTSLKAAQAPTSPTLTLTAHQLVPSNALSQPDYPAPTIPRGCTLDVSRTAYIVPRRGPGSSNPDSGLSVDLLEPRYELLPLFTITEQSGALLSSTPHSSLSPSQFTSTLKLRLQATEREVKIGSEEQSEEERRRTEANNLYSLFTGRTPVLPWPTKELVGVEELYGEGDRVQGAFRGLDEWLTGRGEERPVLGDSREGAASSAGSLGFISGFSLQIRRQYDPTSSPRSFLPTANRSPPPDLQALADEAPRRQRGVGANGGPAVLWNGEEADPEAGAGVAVLRANAEAGGPGGFVFHLPRIPTQRVPPAEEQFVGEEIVRTDREEFYPIKSPARPFTYDDHGLPTTTEAEVAAASLEGLWVGTYGGHGLEFGYLNLKLTPEDSDAEDSETRTYQRVIDFTKVTGDSNVPSGQLSWTASLPSLTLPSTVSLSAPSTSLGPIPSVRNSDLLRWSSYDPSDPRSSTPDIPRWETGAVAGAGRVALSGFVNPGWTGAVVTFVRSTTVVEGGYDEDAAQTERERREVEGVEEIRVRWAELGKVGVFKRVRV